MLHSLYNPLFGAVRIEGVTREQILHHVAESGQTGLTITSEQVSKGMDKISFAFTGSKQKDEAVAGILNKVFLDTQATTPTDTAAKEEIRLLKASRWTHLNA